MRHSTGILFGIIAGLLWSFTFLAPKLVGQFSSTEILLGRYLFFFLISVFFFPMGKFFQFFKTYPHYLKEAVIISITGFSGYYFLLIGAVKLIGVPFSSFMMGMVPVTMVLFSGNFKVNIKTYRLPLIFIILGMLTLLVADFNSSTSSGSVRDKVIGGILAFCALAAWTYYALRNGKFLVRHPEVKGQDWASVLGYLALPTVILFLCLESTYESTTFYSPEASSQELWLLIVTSIAIGVGSSWLATVCWNIAGTILSPELLGQMVVSETCFAIIINAFYEDRFLLTSEIMALFFLLLGILLSTQNRRGHQLLL